MHMLLIVDNAICTCESSSAVSELLALYATTTSPEFCILCRHTLLKHVSRGAEVHHRRQKVILGAPNDECCMRKSQIEKYCDAALVI